MRANSLAMLAVIALLLVAPSQLLASTADVLPWLQSAPRIQLSRERAPAGTMMLTASIRSSDAKGFVLSDYITHGFLANGQEVMVIPLGSGGSGGVFYSLLFTRINGAIRFVGYVPSPQGHLDISIAEGNLRIRTPVYSVGDPNCCPSHHHMQLATLSGISLVTIRRWNE